MAGSRNGWFMKRLCRFMGNGLFVYTISALVFTGTSNSGTNCLEFARQIVIAATPTNKDSLKQSVFWIAIAAISIVCLVNYFWPAVGRHPNKIFAFVKICLVLSMIIAGAILWGRHESIAQFNTGIAASKSDYAKALLVRSFPLICLPAIEISKEVLTIK